MFIHKEVDSILTQKGSARVFNGVVLIADGTQIKYYKSFGYSDRDKKIKIKIDDKFLILSISKQMTVVLLLRLVDQGKINLKDPINKYLDNLNSGWAQIKVENLLNHSSGIKSLNSPLEFIPGTKYMYSNDNYLLAGKIIEKVTGQPYEEQFYQLMKDCGMKNTVLPDNKTKKHVTGYEHINGVLKVAGDTIFTKSYIPEGGIISTANDLLIWNNKLYNGKLISKESFTQMTFPYFPTDHYVFGDLKMHYGLGVYLSDDRNRRIVGHTGYGPSRGFTVLDVYDMNTKKSLIILENQAYGMKEIPFLYERKILDLFLSNPNN
ncbi:MAG: beta-lactamase family protein [Flavobacteriaceae bacterium]|nr:beta-lactamase family protein [Flavobacteriaceae bacterium]